MTDRGRALLNMIRLDTVNMDLFTLSPVSYETYISTFGQANRHQVSNTDIKQEVSILPLSSTTSFLTLLLIVTAASIVCYIIYFSRALPSFSWWSTYTVICITSLPQVPLLHIEIKIKVILFPATEQCYSFYVTNSHEFNLPFLPVRQKFWDDFKSCIKRKKILLFIVSRSMYKLTKMPCVKKYKQMKFWPETSGHRSRCTSVLGQTTSCQGHRTTWGLGGMWTQ